MSSIVLLLRGYLLFEKKNVDAEILKKRTTLRENQIKLKYVIFDHSIHARIGEAYLSAIVERFSDSAGAIVG